MIWLRVKSRKRLKPVRKGKEEKRGEAESSARWKSGETLLEGSRCEAAAEVERGRGRNREPRRLHCIASVGLLHHTGIATAIRGAESATLQANAPTRTHATRRN